LLHDEARRKELGASARRRLDSALSWSVSAKALIELMTRLIGAPPQPAHLDPEPEIKITASQPPEPN